MPKHTKKTVTSIQYYSCGQCTNRLGFAYRGFSFRKHVFPSGVFLIKHATKGYILFDTGYSTDIYKTGIKGWIYRFFNPTRISAEEEINHQLQSDGIGVDEISFIILSHLHPDHIGGLRFFPKSKVIVSNDCDHNRKNPSFTDLIFGSLLPRRIGSQIVRVEDMGLKQRTVHSKKGYDLFDDGSIVVVPLDGHAHGHIGALVSNKLLLAGDSCWGSDLLYAAGKMRPFVKLIHNNHQNFLRSLDFLQELRKKGVTLCFSHDVYLTKELLNEE